MRLALHECHRLRLGAQPRTFTVVASRVSRGISHGKVASTALQPLAAPRAGMLFKLRDPSVSTLRAPANAVSFPSLSSFAKLGPSTRNMRMGTGASEFVGSLKHRTVRTAIPPLSIQGASTALASAFT